MGNRETFNSPGFQWMSVGSGIEHAEGGGTPKGQRTHGFQIWLRMPSAMMDEAPRYGTVQPGEIPTVTLDGGCVRVIAGPLGGVVGPAKFAVQIQILDVELEPGTEFSYTCPDGMDNVMFYGFKGDATLNGGAQAIRAQQICRFDTSGPSQSAQMKAGAQGFRAMVFTGKMTKEKLVWCVRPAAWAAAQCNAS
jgi:redox-sensitive bicupin YhaK (pirin superfamily)